MTAWRQWVKRSRDRHSLTTSVLMSPECGNQPKLALQDHPDVLGPRRSPVTVPQIQLVPQTYFVGCSAGFWGFDKLSAADASAAQTGRLRCEADYYITCDLFIFRPVFFLFFCTEAFCGRQVLVWNPQTLSGVYDCSVCWKVYCEHMSSPRAVQVCAVVWMWSRSAVNNSTIYSQQNLFLDYSTPQQYRPYDQI